MLNLSSLQYIVLEKFMEITLINKEEGLLLCLLWAVWKGLTIGQDKEGGGLAYFFFLK